MSAPQFSFDHLTLGEIAQLEELSGQSLSQFAEEDAPRAKFLTAMAFIAKRRQDPSFTFSEAEMLTLNDLNDVIGSDQPGEAKAD